MEKIFNDILAKPLYGLSDDEYATIKGSSTHFPDGIASKLWGQVMVRAIAEAEHNEGRMRAVNLTEDSYKELDRVFPQMFDKKSELLKNACILCLKENNQEAAHKKMESYLYNALAQVHYQAVNEKMPYYSFRSFSEYSLKDIKEETISVAHPREFNDPLAERNHQENN